MELGEIASPGLDRESLTELSRRSNARGLAQLALHSALLLATGVLVWRTRETWWLLPALVLHGVVLDFLFCALHETIHRTAFASRRLNDAVGWAVGPLLLLPPGYFRLFHFAHHRFTQDAARDPELAAPKPSSWASYVWHASGIPNWRTRLKVTLRHALTGRVPEPFVPVARHRAIVAEARILWAIYAVVAALSLLLRTDAALVYWIVPAIFGQPFLRLYLLAEHGGCPASSDMFANTRTTYTNPAVRLLAWSMPYHVEHHAYPSVPFHALARVNARIRDRIAVSAPGYIAVQRELIRGFRS
jgi:fatty acid desaturase